MRVLVLGSGGREHALCWKLAQVAEIICAPGNPGIAEVARVVPVNLADHSSVLKLAHDTRPDLILIGPEDPLIDGLADTLRGGGFKVFGPGKDGARLEGSKAWSKEIMVAAGVPTAKSFTATSPAQASEAAKRFCELDSGVVIKASGAAVGKGVYVCDDLSQAERAIHDCMVDGVHGSAGETILVEERLTGPEFSLFSLVNESSVVSLPVAQDYKRVGTGDQGPNTGGMGSFAPADWVTAELISEVERSVVLPTVSELRSRGIAYRGVIFSGLMATSEGPKCIEFNVRFGDPEIQSIVRILGDNFFDCLMATASGEEIPVPNTNGLCAVSVVVAAHGYPGQVRKGDSISMGELLPEVVAFHAGTKIDGHALVTNGGRVMALSAASNTQSEARRISYQAVDTVQFEGKQFRTDIAK